MTKVRTKTRRKIRAAQREAQAIKHSGKKIFRKQQNGAQTKPNVGRVEPMFSFPTETITVPTPDTTSMTWTFAPELKTESVVQQPERQATPAVTAEKQPVRGARSGKKRSTRRSGRASVRPKARAKTARTKTVLPFTVLAPEGKNIIRRKEPAVVKTNISGRKPALPKTARQTQRKVKKELGRRDLILQAYKRERVINGAIETYQTRDDIVARLSQIINGSEGAVLNAADFIYRYNQTFGNLIKSLQPKKEGRREYIGVTRAYANPEYQRLFNELSGRPSEAPVDKEEFNAAFRGKTVKEMMTGYRGATRDLAGKQKNVSIRKIRVTVPPRPKIVIKRQKKAVQKVEAREAMPKLLARARPRQIIAPTIPTRRDWMNLAGQALNHFPTLKKAAVLAVLAGTVAFGVLGATRANGTPDVVSNQSGPAVTHVQNVAPTTQAAEMTQAAPQAEQDVKAPADVEQSVEESKATVSTEQAAPDVVSVDTGVSAEETAPDTTAPEITPEEVIGSEVATPTVAETVEPTPDVTPVVAPDASAAQEAEKTEPATVVNPTVTAPETAGPETTATAEETAEAVPEVVPETTVTAKATPETTATVAEAEEPGLMGKIFARKDGKTGLAALNPFGDLTRNAPEETAESATPETTPEKEVGILDRADGKTGFAAMNPFGDVQINMPAEKTEIEKFQAAWEEAKTQAARNNLGTSFWSKLTMTKEEVAAEKERMDKSGETDKLWIQFQEDNAEWLSSINRSVDAAMTGETAEVAPETTAATAEAEEPGLMGKIFARKDGKTGLAALNPFGDLTRNAPEESAEATTPEATPEATVSEAGVESQEEGGLWDSVVDGAKTLGANMNPFSEVQWKGFPDAEQKAKIAEDRAVRDAAAEQLGGGVFLKKDAVTAKVAEMEASGEADQIRQAFRNAGKQGMAETLAQSSMQGQSDANREKETKKTAHPDSQIPIDTMSGTSR